MNNSRRIASISLSPSVMESLEAMSREEQKTKSDIVREALRQYKLDRQWTRLRKIGSRMAIKLGIETDKDIVRLMGR